MSLLFSVVVPVYNRAQYVRRAIRDILSQTEKSYEIIVVDDGSTDASADEIRAFGDGVRYVYQENAGPGAARNTGIDLAQGEYVVFFDSDDRWFPWTLATYRQAIEQHGRPSFLGGSLLLFSKDDEIEYVRHRTPRFDVYETYLDAAEDGIYVGSCMAAARRKALLEIGGFTMRRINAEDHDLTLRLGIHPGFVYVGSPDMVGLRFHDDRISGNMARLSEGLQHLIDQEMEGAYPGGNERAYQRRRIIAQHARSASLELAKHAETRAALKLYSRTLSWQLHSEKWRYILGFPLIALQSLTRNAAGTAPDAAKISTSELKQVG